MSQSNGNFVAFQLLLDGSIEPIKKTAILDHLISININFIYSIDKKHIYIWLGKNANQALKNNIQKFENIFMDKHPDYRILRHFTVDEGQEPDTFFESLNLSKKDIEAGREKWRKYQMEIYGEIDDLKIQLSSFQMAGDYTKTESFAIKIIELAKKIQDDDVIAEYQQYLAGLEEKKKYQAMKADIIEQIPIKIKELSQAMDQKEHLKAHEIAETIQEWYDKVLKRMIPGDYKDLLAKEEDFYSQYHQIQGKIGLKSKQLKRYLQNNEIERAHKIAQELIVYSKENLNKPPEGALLSLIEEEKKKYADQQLLETKISEKIKNISQGIESASSINDYTSVWDKFKEVQVILKTSINMGLKSEWMEYKKKLEAQESEWNKTQAAIAQKESEIDREIDQTKEEIATQIQQRHYDIAIKLSQKISVIVHESTDPTKIEENSQYQENLAVDIEEMRILHLLGDDIDKKLQKVDKKIEERSFDQILQELTHLSSNPNLHKIPTHKAKLDVSIEKILQQKETYEEKLALYARLKQNIEANREKHKWNIAIKNTEKLVDLAQELNYGKDFLEYSELIIEFKKSYEEAQRKSQAQHQKLMEDAESIKDVIEVSNDVLPLVESLSIDDVIGDMSDDVDQMLEQIGSLLEDNRVEIKNDLASKSTIRTASGEVLEIEQSTEILMQNMDATDGTPASTHVEFAVNSGLTNPFDESIEEAIIEDLIPYNFEINEIELNGESPLIEPTKTLEKGGVKLGWTVNNIAPHEKIDIHYSLRRRVSRTIILPFAEELKIIKTHKDVEELEIEGLYNARLKFSNNFNTPMKGVVIEDVIPTFYLYEVKLPDDLKIAGELEQSSGSLVKWNLKSIPDGYSSLHWYKLLEIYLFEELKIQVKKMSNSGFEKLQSGDLKAGIKKYQELMDLLHQYE